jgi:glycosyltransferase involved in cell wall biosynthesis
VIEGIKRAVPEMSILVVNDGSDDSTASISRAAGAIVVTHPFNMGYGVTIQTGYKYALIHNYDYIVQLDADGQHDPSCIPALLAPVVERKSDIAIGSRFLEGVYKPPFARRLGMAFFRGIVSFVTGMSMTDTTSGFQAFNRDIIRFFSTDIFPFDYPDADMLITLHRAGFRMTEVPVRMSEKREGNSMHGGIKPVYYIFKMFLSILVTLLRERPSGKGANLCR